MAFENRNSATSTPIPQPYGNDIPVAVVTQSQLTKTTPTLLSPEAATGVYFVSMVDIQYINDQHVLQMPVTSSDSTASFAYTASPTMKRVVTYHIQKSQTFPLLPAIYTNDPNDVLLHFELIPGAIDLETDGQNQKYIVKGRYTYGYKDTSKVVFYTGVLPWINIPFENTAIPDFHFVGGIASPAITLDMNLPMAVT